MTDPTKELAFQNDVIAQMVAAGYGLKPGEGMGTAKARDPRRSSCRKSSPA